MKYITTIILLMLLCWTWNLGTSASGLSLEQHKKVEMGIESDIRAFIQQRYPSATDLYCPQLYTEVTQPASSDLKIHFRCLITLTTEKSEIAEQVFEGSLLLRSSDGFETWTAAGGDVRDSEVRFINGSIVSPEKEKTNPPSTDAEKSSTPLNNQHK